jgi:hypothetical protein
MDAEQVVLFGAVGHNPGRNSETAGAFLLVDRTFLD